MPRFSSRASRRVLLSSTSRLLLLGRRRIHSSSSLCDAGPLASRLASRSVLRFAGPEAARFLHSLLTNDILPLVAASGESSGSYAQYAPTPNMAARVAPPVYAAMLTPQGRFLYDLFVYRPPPARQRLDWTGSGPNGDEDEEVQQEGGVLLADVDADVVDEMVDCFRRYRLRSKVEIDNVSEKFSCWQRFGSNLSHTEPSTQEPEATSIGWGTGVDHAAESSTQGNNRGWQWFKDPRLDCLGYRGIFPANTIPPLVESDKEADERHYLLWRLERGVAEGSAEIPKGEAIPLEYNLAGLNAISFEKGCYVGQELVARTHHRGVIRKRLMPLKFVDENGQEVEQAVSPGSDIIDEASGKKVGTVNTALGCRGMGLVKLEAALRQPTGLHVKNKDIKIQAIKPDWWPAEWTQVRDQQTAVA